MKINNFSQTKLRYWNTAILRDWEPNQTIWGSGELNSLCIISCWCYSPYSFHFHYWFDHCFDAVLVYYHSFDTFYLVGSRNGWLSSHPVIWFGLNKGHNDEVFSKQFGLVKMTYCWRQLMPVLKIAAHVQGTKGSLGGPNSWWTGKLISFESWGNHSVEMKKQCREQNNVEIYALFGGTKRLVELKTY